MPGPKRDLDKRLRVIPYLVDVKDSAEINITYISRAENVSKSLVYSCISDLKTTEAQHT